MNGLPSTKVKKLEKFWNKRGSTCCKLFNLNVPGSHYSHSLPILRLLHKISPKEGKFSRFDHDGRGVKILKIEQISFVHESLTCRPGNFDLLLSLHLNLQAFRVISSCHTCIIHSKFFQHPSTGLWRT